mmetsp:Transcript_21143/g.50264  ORF Transcript_21143/g.50264 Transcript_21143/m.50264 type:complete len:1839 (+) Transcript_21143:1915-7431(+)
MLDWGGDGEDLSEVTVVKEARRRRGLAATALRTERVVNFTAKPADRPKPRSRPAASGPVPKPATPTVAAKASATTALPSNAQIAVNDTATPSDAKKRGRDEAEATDSMEVETPVEWRPSTGRVVENVGEGNCLWHCLAAFSSTPAVKRSHRQIRQYTVHCMRERSDELRPIWEAMGKFNDAGKPSQFEWEDYLSDQNTHGQWSGAFEVAAWAVATNHRVWITTDTGKLHLINPDVDLENAWVALRYRTEGHYELWAGAREEEFWARACDLSVQGRQQLDELLRGGGRPTCRLSDFASSRASRAPSARKASLSRTASRKRTQGVKAKRTLSDFASTTQNPQPSSPARPSSTPDSTAGPESGPLASSCRRATPESASGLGPSPSGSLGTPAPPAGPGAGPVERQVKRAKVCTTARCTLSDFATQAGSDGLRGQTSVHAVSVRHQASDDHGAGDDEEPQSWECDVCHCVVRPGVRSSLTVMRNNHIIRAHPNVPKSAFSQLWWDRASEVPIQDVPQALRVWTCSYCHKGIRDDPSLPEHVVQAAGRKHLYRCTGRRISLRANLTRCSKLGLTRQVAGGTTSAKARVQQMKVDALPQGPTRHVATHVICPFPRRSRGDKAPLRLIWGGCAKCARQFEYFAASMTRCYPEERAKHLRANVTVWKKYRVDSASLWSELVRAWGLTSAEALKLDQWATKRFRKAMDGVPPLTTSLWQRDLCAENIEPNPGPCSLTYLNVNGLAGAFRALQRLPCSNLEVVCLAETQANQRQHRDLQQRLASLGFRSFGVQGRVGTDASGRAFARGGLLVAVKGHVKARCVNVHSSARGDMVVVDFLGFFLGFVWQREAEIPQGGLDDQVLLLKGLAEERLVPWAAVGDWNQIPTLHPAVASDSLSWHAPLDDVGVPLPSRFGYMRCIDYLVGVMGGPWHSFCHSPLVLSDHKALCFAIDFPSLVEAPCYLRPTACYKKPAHLSACQWSQLVSKSWQLQVPPAPGGNPDSEWRAFCDVLETTLQDAAREAGHAIHTGATRAKGSTPVLMKSGEFRRFTSTPTSFQERKLEKLLGRLYELERQERQGPPDHGLADAVHRTWPKHLGRFGGCAEAIRVVRAKLQQVRDSGMRQRISHWRQRLATGGRAASRWLATSQVVSPHTLLPPAANQNGGEAPLPASSAPECLNELRRYWNTIWQRPGTPEELGRLREGRLSRPRGQRMEGDWHISPELLVQHLKAKLQGSAGADGWRADELLAFPMATWRCFLDLWHSWCQQGAFPSCWRHSRQIFLPKAEVLDGALEVDRMRPICVQPVLCRALSSCMAQLCREWVLTKVDGCTFGALRGRGVEAAVLLLDAALGKDSIMFSLDFRKCFDMMSPEPAIGILEHEGLHPQWARHLHFMWIDQQRWLQLGVWTDSDSTLVPNSVPQGCAMAPLALVCLLAEASRDVPRVAAEAGFRQCIFIDDRTFVTSSVAAALRAWRGWTGWSHRLGLAENGQKLCVLCTHPQKRHELVQGGVPVRALAEEARVLGVDFSLGSTTATATRDQRLLKAAAILQRLANLPVGQATKRLLFRTRASPLASWGAWLSADPVRESAKLTTQLKRCLGQVSTMGSRDLWLLLEGHWSAPAFTAAVSATAAYGRAKAYWDAQGLQLPPARWFRRVSGFFGGLGFRHVLPDTWSHPIVGDFVMAGPQPRQWIGRTVHLLRECWRYARFAAFVEHNRRDSRALRGHVVYDPLQVSAARKMYLQASGDERAVMHGSALSSAVYGVMSGHGAPSTCRWCHCAVVPTWEHLAWHCDHFSSGRPPRPDDALRHRLGWPSRCADASAWALLRFLADIRRQVLDFHGPPPVAAHGGR